VRGLKEERWGEVGSKFAHLTSVHPCYSERAHFKFARVHLPVAPKCNIQCRFCTRSLNKCEYRPGVAGCIDTPEQALKRVEDAAKKFGDGLRVVGIAGPGEPLFNEATFEAFRLVRERFPDLILCVASNGLLLPDTVGALSELGVRTVTVTINAVSPETAAKIYAWVRYGGETLRGVEGVRLLLKKQYEGVRLATENGMLVKINTVLIPEINDKEVEEIAKRVKEAGAILMNVIPLIPLHEFKDRRPPTCEELREVRQKASKYLPQFRLCRQCRADAVGIPGVEVHEWERCGSPAVASEYFHG